MLKKLTSGRFILTIIAGLVFAYVSVTGTLEPQTVGAILAMVFVSYFNKKDNGDTNGH